MEVILDSNFIIGCVKKKIEFIDKLEEMGFRVLLPREVYQELKDLRLNVSPSERDAIEIAFEILDKKKVEKMTVGGRNVDEGLIDKGKKGHYIATLDRAIRNVIPNKVIIDDSTKGLMLERA